MSGDVVIQPTDTPISLLPSATPAILIQPTAQPTILIQVTTPGGFSLANTSDEPYVLTKPGNLTTGPGGAGPVLDGNYTLDSYTVSLGVAPTGTSVILDVNKNGTTIFTTQANRPTVAAGAVVGSVTPPDVTSFAPGDRITVDVDQVGSTFAGTNLVVVLRLRRS
jgi:hypothetical protein